MKAHFNRLLGLVVVAFLTSTADAVTYTWVGATGDVNLDSNWNPVGFPGTGDEIDFTAVGNASPTQSAATVVKFMEFLAGAQPYTYNSNGFNLTIGSATSATAANKGSIDNFSSNTQIINIGGAANLLLNGAIKNNTSSPLVINMETGILTTPAVNAMNQIITPASGSSIVINGGISPGNNQNNSSSYLDFTGAGNTYINVDTSIHPLGNVNGGAWVAGSNSGTRNITYFEHSGRVYLGNIGTAYIGRMVLGGDLNGNVRLTHNDSLGSTGGRLYLGLQAAAGGGAATQNTTLELAGGISVTRGAIFLEPRSGVSNAADPHILNVSGNNTINTTGDWDTSSSEAGNWNIQSDSGKLTIAGGNFYATAAAGAGQVTLQLRGAGDGQMDAPLLHWNNGPSLNVVKSGTGTWTFSRIPVAGETGSGGAADIVQPAATANLTSIFTGSMTATQGTLELTGAGASGALSIPAYDIRNGAILKVSGLTGGGLVLNDAVPTTVKGDGTVLGSLTAGTGHTIAPGDSAIGTLDISSALTLNGGGALSLELTSTPTNLSGVNDRIAVAGNLSLAGLTTINVVPVNGSLGNGTYKLVTYAGSLLSGDASNLTLAGTPASPRQTFALSSNTSNEIDLLVTGAAANLTWVGGVNGNIWVDGLVEPNSVNWSGAADSHFYNGDSVTFGNTGATSVNVSGTVSPGNMTFTNNTGQNYILSGSGSTINASNMIVTGSGNVTVSSGNFIVSSAVTMNGSGTVEFTNSGDSLSLPATVALNSGTLVLNRSDDFSTSTGLTGSGTFRKANNNTVTATGDSSGFSGTVQVTGGTLKVGNANGLGGAAAVTTVSSGAALDLNGTSVANGTVQIAGTGNGTTVGALINTGANAPVISNVAMTADATIGASGGYYTIGTGTGGSFTAPLNNNFTLTVDTEREIDVFIPGDMGVKNIKIEYTGASTAEVLYIEGATTLGPNTGTLTLGNNGRLGFYGRDSAINVVSQATGAVTKPIEVAGNGGIEIYRGNMVIDSTVNITGNLNTDMYVRDNGTWALNYTGPITGSGSMSVHANSNSSARQGVIALTNNNNTYGGTTTIGGGGGLVGGGVSAGSDRITLSIGNGGTSGSIGAGDITIAGGTLLVNQSDSYVLPNNLSGAGNFAVGNPTGQVTLTGASNTYTGVTDIRAGQLIVASNNLGADGTNNAGYIQMAVDPTSALVLSGGVTLTKAAIYAPMRTTNAANVGPQIISASGNNEITGAFVTDSTPNATNKYFTVQSNAGSNLKISGNVIADATGEAFLTIRGAGNGEVSGQLLQPTTVFFNGNAVSGNIMSVIKEDSGSWTLSGANEYTGSTSVQAGTLSITNPYLADAADVFLKAGSNLNLNFAGIDTVDSLFINNTSQAIGTWGAIGSGAAHQTSLITGSGLLQVSTLGTLAGDYNNNGIVDAADYILWRKDPASHGGTPDGYNTWRANFGTASGAGSSFPGAVPEPCALLLAVVAAIGLMAPSRRR